MISGERLSPEQFDTLPDVPEPAENPELVGHESDFRALVSAYRSGRLHHALLLHGPRGIGKATFAFAFARHLLAHPDNNVAPADRGEIDRDGALFRQIASGAHPGLLHLTRPLDKDGKKFKTAITVDEIRRVSKFLSMTSHDGGHRIVIVDPADDMNTNAANALLKNLEEPPSRAIFVLISHAPGGLLPTIRSRCQAIRLQPLSDSDVLTVLQALGESVPDDEAARLEISAQAEGSPRNALLMTRYGGLDLTQMLDELISAQKMDIPNAYKLAEAISARDAEIQFSILNDALLERIATHARQSGQQGQLRRSAMLADLWHETRDTIEKTAIYNLDKKQHVVGLITKLNTALTQ